MHAQMQLRGCLRGVMRNGTVSFGFRDVLCPRPLAFGTIKPDFRGVVFPLRDGGCRPCSVVCRLSGRSILLANAPLTPTQVPATVFRRKKEVYQAV